MPEFVTVNINRCALVRRIDAGIQFTFVISGAGIDTAGPLLLVHYSDPAKIDALFALGYVQRLGPAIGEQHIPFANDQRGWCVSLPRDVGNTTGTEFQSRPSLDEVEKMAIAPMCEVLFLFDGGQWLFGRLRHDRSCLTMLEPLEAAIEIAETAE